MKLEEVMQELADKATPSTKKTFLRHGATEPLFGVKIGDLKVLQKKLKGQQELALELYATGNSDAMYLAGLIADGTKMTRRQLDQWASGASWHMIASCPVAWIASDHPQAIDVSLKWISSKRELTALAGWSALSLVASTVPDDQLPIDKLSDLLDRVAATIQTATDRVRYVMNSYIISCGAYVEPLGEKAIATARKVGVVEVDMGDTACQVPVAESYIMKSRRGARVAPKRKAARC